MCFFLSFGAYINFTDEYLNTNPNMCKYVFLFTLAVAHDFVSTELKNIL